ncbi:conserved hypothetical protein [Trichinella spiralis]|uniref:hypothetical protein n=1 Tax=Trichinella spiralis TaxID=6334 RepID=UPI0001EFB53D|nr:conserved hypothetical protein [Trichinella spiralis]
MMNSVDQTSQAIASMPQHQKSLHAALQHFSVPTATKDALKKGKRQPLRAEIAELTETYQGSCLPTFRKSLNERFLNILVLRAGFSTDQRPMDQRLCDNESDLVAIRDAINAVDEGKEAFINSRRARQEELPDSEKAKALADYDQLLGLVTRLQSKANDLLKNSSQQPDLSQNTATLHQGECVPLSAIVQIRKLLTYNGNILEFNAFWGQFDGAVHHRKDFDNVTKFVHLKSCLSGEALQLANGLTVMAENYEDQHPTTVERSCCGYTMKSTATCCRYAHLEETLTHVTQAYIWLSDAVAQASQLAAATDSNESHPHEGVNQPIEALMLTNICDDISSVPYRNKNWKHLGQLHLPEERDMNLPIHILIGLDFCGRLLGEKILRGGHDDPVAIEKTLGWVVFGPVNPSPNTISQVNCVQIEKEMERTLKKFWELDCIGIKPQEENPTQDLVSAKFHSDLTHDGSRYTVGLLWKPGGIRLPNNRSLAEQRLQAMERVEDCDACRFLWRNCVQDSGASVSPYPCVFRGSVFSFPCSECD